MMRQFIWSFYELAEKPERIDIVIVYDLAKLRRVVHRYEGRTDIKRDGFVFREPDKKTDALLGIIKVL